MLIRLHAGVFHFGQHSELWRISSQTSRLARGARRDA